MRRLLSIATLGILVLMLAVPAMAANNVAGNSFYGQGTLALPMGDFGDMAGMGFGAAGGMIMPYNDVMNFRGEIGYTMFSGKDFGAYEYSMSMIPILALVEYHFGSTGQTYGLGGLGFTMVKSSIEGTVDLGEYGGGVMDLSTDDTSSEVSIVLGGGYHLNEQMDLEARYNIVSDASYLSVHFNYHF